MRNLIGKTGLITFFSAALLTSETCLAQASAAVAQNPPPGIELSSSDRELLEKEIAHLAAGLQQAREKLAGDQRLELLPDVEIWHKTADWALRFHEFINQKQVETAHAFLAEGEKRLAQLSAGDPAWTRATGLVVRGYRSEIDHSVQPYGVVVPETWTSKAQHPALPLLVWLAGRNNQRTELAFCLERQKSRGDFTPKDTLVLHPYGRFCNATKFAGETDVFEAMKAVQQQYGYDPEHVAVAGFSMGGASTWHLGAHHAGEWCAISPGAGFAETAIYGKILAPGKTPPPPWQQKLYGLYDATVCAANFGNTPTLAYSGEIDPQRQSADLMESQCAAEGVKLNRVIGPQTAHKYEPGARAEIAKWLEAQLSQGREPDPAHVHLSTTTLRFPALRWIALQGLEEHWRRADLDATRLASGYRIATKNVRAFQVQISEALAQKEPASRTFEIDGQAITLPSSDMGKKAISFVKNSAQKWTKSEFPFTTGLQKKPGLTGPIDDAFFSSFLFVRPSGRPQNAATASWVEAELARAIEQWRTVFRGEVRVKSDREITAEDLAKNNLVVWGDPGSNLWISRILASSAAAFPLRWDSKNLQLAGQTFSSADHMPVLIYPNPLSPAHYVVFNSSFTFRAGSKISNALQTPMLPDFAIVDVRQPATEQAPGEISAAGFFDENWQAPR